MLLNGPYQYELIFDPHTFSVKAPGGGTKFSGPATSTRPKLYVVSVEQRPIYVGVTKQSMRSRLRFGWNATGVRGYYGYAWRHQFTAAHLDIWCDDEPDLNGSLRELETVEAEVVFLIRAIGQWPLWQTEIHFHPSEPGHRETAESILANYKLT